MRIEWQDKTDREYAPDDLDFEWSNPDPTMVVSLYYYPEETVWTVSIDYTEGRYHADAEIKNKRDQTTREFTEAQAKEWAESRIATVLKAIA